MQTLFKHGGNCATIRTKLAIKWHQFQRRRTVKAQRKLIQHDDVLACRQRMAWERGKAVRGLGTDYLLHPENTQAKWGNKNVH